MKKWLSILGAIGLTAISTTSLISCQKPNNNENGGGNKPEPPYNPQKPQQPPVESKWKLVDDVWEEVKQSSNEKWYIGIYYRYDEKDNKYWVIEKFNKIKEIKTNYWDQVYRWDGNNEPQIPEIDINTGKVIFYTDNNYQNVRSFLLKYINLIVQENIRVQQGGNPNYNDPNLGSERIIFDFEIVDESLARNSFKSIYRMILTIDERKNIIAGSLQLFHNWKYADEPVKNQKNKLGFLFTFVKEKDNIFNFDANTNSYLENGNIKYYEKMKGQIDINKFLKAFFAHALVPVFQNRSNFIESGYIDNLQYDTVLINFFGLKLVNFRDVLIDKNNLYKSFAKL